VTKEKAPELRRRRGRIKKIRVTVFGFKIWVVWDPNSHLPLAMRVSGGVKMYEMRRFENASKIKSYLPGSRH